MHRAFIALSLIGADVHDCCPQPRLKASSRRVEGAVGVESDHTYLFGSLTGSGEKVRFELRAPEMEEKKLDGAWNGSSLVPLVGCVPWWSVRVKMP